MRHVGDQPDQTDNGGGNVQGAGVGEQLPEQHFRQVFIGSDPGDHDAGCRRDDQRGDLGDQAITDGEQGIGRGGLANR